MSRARGHRSCDEGELRHKSRREATLAGAIYSFPHSSQHRVCLQRCYLHILLTVLELISNMCRLQLLQPSSTEKANRVEIRIYGREKFRACSELASCLAH